MSILSGLAHALPCQCPRRRGGDDDDSDDEEEEGRRRTVYS